jgi:septal ring factor EnvC (AmiA/AmiB activator)
LGALVALVLVAPGARAADRSALEAKLGAGREEASALAGELQASQAELASAEAEAARAEKHEERLTALLTEGEEREAQLSAEVTAARHHLAVEKERLRSSREALAQRLIDIYETGVPDATSVILGSGDVEELVTRDTYLRAINESDSALARRVGETRDSVHREVVAVAAKQRQAVAYDERVQAARTRSSPRPGNSTAAKANPRTPRRPNRTASPPKSGPTPEPAPGSAAASSAVARRPPSARQISQSGAANVTFCAPPLRLPSLRSIHGDHDRRRHRKTHR